MPILRPGYKKPTASLYRQMSEQLIGKIIDDIQDHLDHNPDAPVVTCPLNWMRRRYRPYTIAELTSALHFVADMYRSIGWDVEVSASLEDAWATLWISEKRS